MKTKIFKGKGRLATLLALIATVLCAVIAAFTGLFGSIGGVQTASANAKGTSYEIGTTSGTFNAANIQKMMGQIMGKTTASYNELKTFIDKQPEKQYESSKFNNNAGYFTVKLGGIDWNVVFASEDTNGEVVATLWQASSTLKSQWHTWYSGDKTLYYPSNMYGTSFIRASLVNSTYAYQAIDETIKDGTSGSGSGATANRQFFDWINTTNAEEEVTKVPINPATGKPTGDPAAVVKVPKNDVYQTYHPIVEKYDKYLDTPSQMPWQWYQSIQKQRGYDWWGNNKNEGLFGADYGSWWSPDDDYTNKNSYSAWGGDKIWLPSGYETGFDNHWNGDTFDTPAVRSGLWGLPSEARKNGEISWLRSGNYNYAHTANSITPTGNHYSHTVTSSLAVRPALHLNLKSAASAAGLIVDAPTFDSNAITKTVAYNGAEQQIAITAPATGVSVTVSSPASYDGTNKKIKVKNAGTYTVTLSTDAGYGWSDGSVGPKHLTLTVTPKSIASSTIAWKQGSAALAANGEVPYTGSPVQITASAAGVGSETVNLPVIISGDNVNAGTFTLTAVNTDPNYTFTGSLTKTVKIIKQAISKVEWSAAGGSEFEYDALNHAPTASYVAKDGKRYSLPVTLTKDGNTVTEAVNAGSYTATVAAGDYNTNFNLATAATMTFTVAKREVQIDWGAESFVYSGADRDSAVTLKVASGLLGSDTLTLTATYKSGDKKNVTEGGFVIEASISGASSNYKLPAVITHTYKITPLALKNIKADVEGTYTYNGSIQTPEINLINDTNGNIVAGDTVKAYVSGGGINAGEYDVTIYGTENANYKLDGAITAKFKIEPKDITTSEIKWSVTDGTEYTYNGQNRAPEAWFVYNGVTYALNTDLNEAVNANANKYTANVKAGVFQNNFKLLDKDTSNPTGNASSITFKINKAKITANDVEWSFMEGSKFAPEQDPAASALFRFNNAAYVLTISFKDADNNSVSTGGDGKQWKTGSYTATAALGTGSDYDNFEITGTVSREFKITESATGKYTVIWEGFSAVVNYNGADQKPGAYIIVDGEKIDLTVLVEKWDGSNFQNTVAAKDAGRYRFTARKTGYSLTNDKVECRIDPRVISVDYANLTGLSHGDTDNVTATTTDPVAKAEIDGGVLTLAVKGSGHVAGSHTVSVEAQVEVSGNKVATGNYVISNATAVQTVGKKLLTYNDIEWKLDFTYDGKVKTPEGKVKVSALTTDDKAGGAYVMFEYVNAVSAGVYKIKVIGISNDSYTYTGEVTLTIKAISSATVLWEGVQNGGSVTYDKQNNAPKAYIEVDGEKVYLDVTLQKQEAGGSQWTNTTHAIIAGKYKAIVNAATSGNYTYAQSEIEFEVKPYELSAIYLTRNVFTYDGKTPAIEVYAIGANNEKVVISDKTVLNELGTAVTSYPDAGSYVVQVQAGVLGSNQNYKFGGVCETSFMINPKLVEVKFEISGNSWSWKADDAVPTVTVKANATDAIEVKYGKLGADNVKPESKDDGISYVFEIKNISGEGIITAYATSANYQIIGSGVQTFNVIVDGEAQAKFMFESADWSKDNQEFGYDATNGKTISVSGDDDVTISYYKDGVLLSEPITTTAGLEAGTYLITASCSTRKLTTNINVTMRTFKILPQEVDFATVGWVINGSNVAGNKVSYNGQIYNASLNLGALADNFDVYYTNDASKNVGSVTTTATVVPKNANYVAKNVSESYSWAIESVAAKVAWNKDGTVASIDGDCNEATGGSFFEKEGTTYKVVYKKNGVVLESAPTEAGEYTAEVVLALGNGENVEVSAQSFDFTIGGSALGGETLNESNNNWLWIVLIVIASLALIVAFIALVVAKRKKAAISDDDGFYDDVTEEDLK